MLDEFPFVALVPEPARDDAMEARFSLKVLSLCFLTLGAGVPEIGRERELMSKVLVWLEDPLDDEGAFIWLCPAMRSLVFV
jgi:hypothetical protein